MIKYIMENSNKMFYVCCMALFFLASCGSNVAVPIEIGNNEPQMEGDLAEIEVSQDQFAFAKMQIGQITEQRFPIIVRATGRIEVPAKNQIRVSAYSGGYVTNIELVPGQKVNKGQRLFTLENPDFVQMQQDYLEAKESLAYLESDYERQKKLADENITSQKNFLKAESEYRVTLAKMQGMKKRLSLLNISVEDITPQNMVSSISVFSPSSGFVTEVYAMRGMFLNQTGVAVDILNTDDVHLELRVFEKDILKIEEGQEIMFRIPDASTENFVGEVHLIGKIVDEEKRIIRVHGHLKNEEDRRKVISGMYVDAEIITEQNDTYGVPESAIVTEDGKNFVLIFSHKDGDLSKFQKKEVDIGQRRNGFVQILNVDQFSKQEDILINGAFNLIGIE
jgi:cobalt-zinc-cadmium efflux system membrane fusion protein